MSGYTHRVRLTIVAGLAVSLVVLLMGSAAVASVRPSFSSPKVFDGVAKTTLTKAGDLNGDGRLDLVSGGTDLVDGSIVSVVVVQLNGRRSFHPWKEIVVRTEHAANGLDAIRLVDVNGDRTLDVEGAFKNVFPAPSNLFVMLGNGDGTFAAPLLLTNGDPLVRTLLSFDVADVNGDRKPDLVSEFGDSSPNRISVRPGKGDGTFGAAILSGDTGIDWKPSVVVADFTGDGIPDVLAANSPLDPNVGATALMLEKGAGDGTFTLAQSLFIDGNADDSATAADLNGDGRSDLVISGSAGTDGGRGGLYVALASGEGLLAPQRYGVPAAGQALADLNGDGAPDIATGSGSAPYLWISLNAGDGTFGNVVTYRGSGPMSVAGDFRGDSKPDLVAENFGSLGAALLVNKTP
jgi:hypothetical protein